jgi:hypothetical protein
MAPEVFAAVIRLSVPAAEHTAVNVRSSQIT